MANISYLSLSGETQGLISAGCSTLDSVGNKAQPEHKDQIMVYALMHSISRSQNVNHHELIITKPVDKSSPLLAKALSDNEKMAICEFILYRTSKAGIYQPYGNDSNLLIVFYVQIMPDDLVMQLHRF